VINKDGTSDVKSHRSLRLLKQECSQGAEFKKYGCPTANGGYSKVMTISRRKEFMNIKSNQIRKAFRPGNVKCEMVCMWKEKSIAREVLQRS
jgi:hypothetical protein